jgi:uncharacterized protein (TIGR03067 family)
MKRVALAGLFLLATGGLGAVEPGDKAAQDELKKLEGTWEFKSSELGGKQAPAEFVKGASIVIKGDKYTTHALGTVVDEGTVKVDPSKKPKTIDRVSSKLKGFVHQGIYELDGDKLRICENANDRPREFDSTKGMFTNLHTFQRKK